MLDNSNVAQTNISFVKKWNMFMQTLMHEISQSEKHLSLFVADTLKKKLYSKFKKRCIRFLYEIHFSLQGWGFKGLHIIQYGETFSAS